MQTNFFSILSSLEAKGEWTLHILQHDNGTMTVSVRLKKTCEDKAAKLIPPLVFTAKPIAMMDNMFFSDLGEASSKTNEVLSNMEHYLKELDRAKKASAKEQKNSNNSKAALPKLTKYEEALTLVDELEKKGKYQEAWMKVPDPGMYPENAEFLRKKREELSRHFAPDLFRSVSDKTADISPDKSISLEATAPEETDEMEDQEQEQEQEQDFENVEDMEEQEPGGDILPF